MIQARRSRFPKSLEREDEVHKRSAGGRSLPSALMMSETSKDICYGHDFSTRIEQSPCRPLLPALMKTQELPRFLREKARLKPRKSRAKAAPRFAGDTGTPEIKKRLQVAIENRGYSSTGHPTIVGARVEAQFPHDRYKIRNQLDPANEWRNLMLWPDRADTDGLPCLRPRPAHVHQLRAARVLRQDAMGR